MPAPKKGLGSIAGKVIKKVIKSNTPAKANARGLKAANKPTKASKTLIGNNEKVAVAYRKGMLKNSPPLREGRVRGGGMATLRRQEAAAKANKMTSNLKNTKPLENVPKGVSNRFDATIKNLKKSK